MSTWALFALGSAVALACAIAVALLLFGPADDDDGGDA